MNISGNYPKTDLRASITLPNRHPATELRLVYELRADLLLQVSSEIG